MEGLRARAFSGDADISVVAAPSVRVPAVRPFQRFVDVFIVVLLAGTGANLLVWRGQMLAEIGWAGRALFLLELLTVIWMVITAISVSGRSDARAEPPAPALSLTIDVLIPVAGESVPLLAQTINAAKAINWPSFRVVVCNDSKLAGKENWRSIELLCDRLGVDCLTRETGHPGKAGNLNYAMTRTDGDILLVVDADHRVSGQVARHLVGWFQHDDVAFVSTPQAFDDSRGDGLNPTEAMFYRAIQPSRDRHGLAFSTGNGVMYRREALTRIGGFSEWSIVEDLHTSIRLHDAGWRSVFHPRPVTTGLAPETAAEYARQRLRWATDSLRILRFDPPWRRHGLSARAKFFYTHTLVSYLVAIMQIGFLMGPAAWIFGRLSLLTDGTWQSQVRYIGPWLLAMAVALIWWSGVRATIRSVRLATAFQPGIFAVALWHLLRGHSTAGGTTNKASQPRFNRVLLAGFAGPVLLLSALTWGVFDQRSGGSDIAMGWAGALFVLAIGPLFTVKGSWWPLLVKTGLAAAVIGVVGGAVATSRTGWQAPYGMYASMQPDPAALQIKIEHNEFGTEFVAGPAVPAPDFVRAWGLDPTDNSDDAVTQVSIAPAEGIYIGFTSDALPFDLEDVDRWERQIADPQIVHWYQQWGSGESRFRGDWLAEIAEAGRVPMVSWEAWAKPDGSFHSADQELGRMSEIADGAFDEYIDEWAVAAAEFGEPMLLRPFHEMNGYWYPWSVGTNGNTAEDYIAAWRHVVERFDNAGANNVSFVWSVNTLASFDEGRGIENYYPGDSYVDWVATSGFNWDDYDVWASWLSAEEVFGETYDVLAGFDKPVMFAEIGTGTEGGDGAAWVEDAAQWFSTLPDLKATVWFDRSYDGSIDFRLGPDQRAALAGVLGDPNLSYRPELELTNHPLAP